jgi:uncharacterized protein YecE (DUF72 family)
MMTLPTRLPQIRIGISGWTYAPWRGIFYPEGLPHRLELSFAAGRFNSIEVNGTFYGSQKPATFERWREETPEDFVFAIKGPRYITHIKRLRDVEAALGRFLETGVLRLGPKLGPILWQFPPNLKFDAELFAAFFDLLPRENEGAALRHAVEIRHDSFRAPDFIELLRRHQIGLVVADTVDWPCLMDLTADFVYCRLHGSEQLYVSGYDDKAIARWAGRVRAWAAGEEPEDAQRILPPTEARAGGRDVYVYFDNDVKVRAPADAKALAERLRDG